MTYTVIASDTANGLLGMCQASSPMAVGSRCMHLRALVGAVASQGNTDPALGRRTLEYLAEGHSPQQALDRLDCSDHFQTRQIGIVTRLGHCAAFTGDATADHRAHLIGDGVVVLGNHLQNDKVIPAMLREWEAGAGSQFETRLVATVAAGRDQGGDISGNRSAAIRVHDASEQPRTDLRVDWQPGSGQDAVTQLSHMLQQWIPLIDFYQRRPNEPQLGDWQDWSKK